MIFACWEYKKKKRRILQACFHHSSLGACFQLHNRALKGTYLIALWLFSFWQVKMFGEKK